MENGQKLTKAISFFEKANVLVVDNLKISVQL